MYNSWRPHGLCSPWNSPGQNTGVGSLCLLQGIFPTQGSNPGLPHCRRILYQVSHKGSLLSSKGQIETVTNKGSEAMQKQWRSVRKNSAVIERSSSSSSRDTRNNLIVPLRSSTRTEALLRWETVISS